MRPRHRSVVAVHIVKGLNVRLHGAMHFFPLGADLDIAGASSRAFVKLARLQRPASGS